MTRDTLRDLLGDLADEQAPVPVAPDTYCRGRRARRRRVVTRAVVAATAAAAAVLVSVPALVPSVSPGPAKTAGSPALPARLHAVPERLAPHTGDEGYRWHSDLLAPSLAIGTTAAVFPVNGGAVVAVSAVDGGYRGIDLPGFDESSFFRFDWQPVALSPDGNRLAYTWHPAVTGDSGGGGYRPSGIRVLDLRTGTISSTRITAGFGVFAHAFSWSPDGRYLAGNLDITTNANGEVNGSENFAMLRLDTATGHLDRAPHRIPDTETGPAVSSSGEVAVVGNGDPVTWLPGREPELRHFEGDVGEWTAAWSPDGSRVAAGSWEAGWFSVGDPSGLGLLTGTAADAPPGSMVRALGWAGADEVALLHRTRDQDLVVSAVPAASPRGGPGRRLMDVEATVDIGQLSVAIGLLDRPARQFGEPDWPTDPARVLTWGAVSGLGVAGALLLAWSRRRRDAQGDAATATGVAGRAASGPAGR